MSKETNKQKFVSTLREIADFVESRPFDENGRFDMSVFYLFCSDAVEFGRNVAAAGTVKKSDTGEYLNADVMFGDEKLQICIKQELVCTRIKVGTQVVEATEEFTVVAVPEHTEDVYKFECPESFIALKNKAAEEVPA